jgi:hypothetical protein
MNSERKQWGRNASDLKLKAEFVELLGYEELNLS